LPGVSGGSVGSYQRKATGCAAVKAPGVTDELLSRPALRLVSSRLSGFSWGAWAAGVLPAPCCGLGGRARVEQALSVASATGMVAARAVARARKVRREVARVTMSERR